VFDRTSSAEETSSALAEPRREGLGFLRQCTRRRPRCNVFTKLVAYFCAVLAVAAADLPLISTTRQAKRGAAT